jgi:DNA-binding NarL/FixJ family response regulator
MPLRLLICSDAPLVQDGLRTMLEAEPDILVIATTDSGVHAMVLARTQKIDIILTGLALKGISGLDLIRQLEKESLLPAPRVVAFTMSDSDESIMEVLHAGVAGLLTKDTTRDELVAALRIVARGHAMLAPSVTQQLLSWLRMREMPPPEAVLQPAVAALTPRERQVLLLNAHGLSAEEIAKELSVGVATIRTHIYRLRTKLQLKDRAQLVSFAYRAGLIRPARLQGAPRARHPGQPTQP